VPAPHVTQRQFLFTPTICPAVSAVISSVWLASGSACIEHEDGGSLGECPTTSA
jgi:hypothetical protein